METLEQRSGAATPMLASNRETRNETRRCVRLRLDCLEPSNCQGTSWQKTTLRSCARARTPLPIDFSASGEERQLARIAVVDVSRANTSQKRIRCQRWEPSGDVFRLFEAHLEWEQGIGVRLVQADSQAVAANLKPISDDCRTYS